MKISLRERAKKFLIEDKYSVIPVGKQKIPLIPWMEFQSRFPTIEEIDSWWDRFPDAQIGIVTGKLSNLTVVDVEKGGDPTELPQETTIISTGGGGYHYYYLYEEGIKNKARIKELTDFRSQGGYVVSADSCSDKGEYVLRQKLPLLPFPKELFPEAERPSNFNIFNSVSSSPTDGNITEYEGFGMGNRNAETTKYIGHVLTQVHPSKWDTNAWDIIVRANQKNTPPLPERELRASYESVKRMEVSKNPDRWTPVGNSFELNKEWKEGEENGEGRIMLMAEAAKLQHIDISQFYPFGFELFDKEIMGGAIPGDLVVIAGQPGDGKTSFAMNITRNFVNSENKVLFFSYEVLLQFVWEKFKEMGMKEEDCLYCPFKTITGNVEWIEQKIKEAKEKYGIKFVIIDHLGYLVPKSAMKKGQENYSIYLTSIMRELKNIARNEEIVIILPVHVRKRGTYHKKNAVLDIEEISGSNGIAQESDLVFLIQRENTIANGSTDVYTGYSLISLGKNRRGSKNPRGYFSMINGIFVRNEEYKGIESNSKSSSYTSKSYYGQSPSEKMNEDIKKEDFLRKKVNENQGLGEDEDREGLPF